MSQALSTMSLTRGFRLTGRMQTQMLGSSLDASPGLDLLKKGDSLCSLQGTYMLSKNPLLICTKPLYAVDKQCSFLAFTLQSDKRQTENRRVRAKVQEDDDMDDDWEYLETDILTSFPDVSNGRPKTQEKMNHKHIKADAVSVSEVVTSCLKSDSKHKEDNHDKGQTVQMSDVKGKLALDKILKLLRQHRSKSSAAPSRDAVSRVQSSNGKPPYNTSYAQDSNGKPPYNTSYAQDSNGKPPYKTSYAQSVVRNRNSKPKDPNHTKDKSSVDSILDVLQKSPPRKHKEKKTSPITAPVVRQQEQVGTISFQPENSGFADDSLNVGIDDEKQLKSAVQHAASHVTDTSSISAVKVGENESLMNGNALQIDSSHTISFQPENSEFADDSLNIGHDDEKQLKSVVQHAASHVTDTSSITAVKVGDNESLMNDNALQIDSSNIQQVDPSTLTLKDLWKVAKANGLTGFYKIKKAELLELLKNQKIDFSMYK